MKGAEAAWEVQEGPETLLPHVSDAIPEFKAVSGEKVTCTASNAVPEG